MIRYNLNRLWSALRFTWAGRLVHRRSDIPLALDLLRLEPRHPSQFRQLGQFLFASLAGNWRLAGADGGYGDESRRFLYATTMSTIATTGANSRNFNIDDYFLVDQIAFNWTVAGTVTALVMDFDFYPQRDAGGTVVDKLDGTNGVITAPTVASQAIGNILSKSLSDTGPVLCPPGSSIQANVTTTTTAGNGMPIVVGFPKPENIKNLTGYVASA